MRYPPIKILVLRNAHLSSHLCYSFSKSWASSKSFCKLISFIVSWDPISAHQPTLPPSHMSHLYLLQLFFIIFDIFVQFLNNEGRTFKSLTTFNLIFNSFLSAYMRAFFFLTILFSSQTSYRSLACAFKNFSSIRSLEMQGSILLFNKRSIARKYTDMALNQSRLAVPV